MIDEIYYTSSLSNYVLDNNKNYVVYCLDKGCNPLQKDFTGESPYELSIKYKRNEITKIFNNYLKNKNIPIPQPSASLQDSLIIRK